MPPIIAQALIEKGVLDGIVSGMWNVVDSAGEIFRANPWLVVAAFVIVGLIIYSSRPR